MENKMNITSAEWGIDTLTSKVASIQVVINGQVMSVPLDLSNRHYAEIMRQVEAGELTITEM